MATKNTTAPLDLFEARDAAGETKVWEYPRKVDWDKAKTGDLVQFSKIRHWDAPATDPVYVEAVGRILGKGITDGEERHFLQVEIIWDESIPRLMPDIRVFVLDK